MHHAITLEALRVLDAIDRKGSFGAAATSLFKVPSALSYTVQKLESDLNIKLFDRTKQRAQFTSVGKLLLERGRELLQAAQALEDAAQQFESGWEVQLRIAQDTILPLGPLLQQIQRFNQLDKYVTIDVSEEVLGGTWDALIHNRCELALGASGEPPKGQIEYLKLGEVDFLFAVAPDHPLTRHKGVITRAAIRAHPTIIAGDTSLILPSRSSGILESRQTIRVANVSAKIAAQKAGIGVGFLPRHLIKSDLERGQLVALPCDVPRLAAPIFMAWHKTNQGKALQWFIKALAEVDWLAT